MFYTKSIKHNICNDEYPKKNTQRKIIIKCSNGKQKQYFHYPEGHECEYKNNEKERLKIIVL